MDRHSEAVVVFPNTKNNDEWHHLPLFKVAPTIRERGNIAFKLRAYFPTNCLAQISKGAALLWVSTYLLGVFYLLVNFVCGIFLLVKEENWTRIAHVAAAQKSKLINIYFSDRFHLEKEFCSASDDDDDFSTQSILPLSLALGGLPTSVSVCNAARYLIQHVWNETPPSDPTGPANTGREDP